MPNNAVKTVLAFLILFQLKQKLKLKLLNMKEKEFSPMTQASKSVTKERKNIVAYNLFSIVHNCLMQVSCTNEFLF